MGLRLPRGETPPSELAAKKIAADCIGSAIRAIAIAAPVKKLNSWFQNGCRNRTRRRTSESYASSALLAGASRAILNRFCSKPFRDYSYSSSDVVICLYFMNQIDGC